jgi:hypothetical protein
VELHCPVDFVHPMWAVHFVTLAAQHFHQRPQLVPAECMGGEGEVDMSWAVRPDSHQHLGTDLRWWVGHHWRVVHC